jgi:DNA polymerase-3 subunit gamma/tau
LICPDEASGFEMLMLRLLAFSPASAATEAQPEVKKKPEVNPVLAIQPATKPISKENAEAKPTLARQEDARPVPAAKLEAKPISTESATAEPKLSDHARYESLKNESAAVSLDWSGLAYELGLDGLAQEIVANSVLIADQDDRLQLALLPEIHELATDTIESEIRQALKQKLGLSLQLELAAAETLTAETPLQAKEERLRQERLTVIDAIRQDKTVKKLQHVFAAELDEASVIKIENNS